MHYRETVVWAKAMEVAREVYRLIGRLPKEETYGMRAQLTRAAVSIPGNIAEGWTRGSPREKLQCLSLAHGSAAELETQVTLCEQIGWFPEPETLYLRATLDEVSRTLTTMRRNRR